MVDQLQNTGRGRFMASVPSFPPMRFTSNYRLLIIPAKSYMAEVNEYRNASKLLIGI